MNDRLSKKMLLEKAYSILLKKLNVKKIYVAFYETLSFSNHTYRCAPNLRAMTCSNKCLTFVQKDKYHGFNYVYIHELNGSDPRDLPKWEVAEYIFKLLEDIDIYVETGYQKRKLVLHKGLNLDTLWVENDLDLNQQSNCLG